MDEGQPWHLECQKINDINMYLLVSSLFNDWWSHVTLSSYKNILGGYSIGGKGRRNIGIQNNGFWCFCSGSVNLSACVQKAQEVSTHKGLPKKRDSDQWQALDCPGAGGSSSPCHPSGKDTATSWIRTVELPRSTLCVKAGEGTVKRWVSQPV